MNAVDQYRALVVDDEAVVRQSTIRALSRVGFICEHAADGRIAFEMASQAPYDLVVTDLRMPEANGHQLAVELLALPSRPAVVVLTGVVEPRLANDLRIRGVDDILFKPIDYQLLATRVKGIVEQRARLARQTDTAAPAPNESTAATDEKNQSSTACLPLESQSPATVAHSEPLTPSPGPANAHLKLTAADVARAVELDPSLAAEILRYAQQTLPRLNQNLRDPRQAAMAIQRAAALRDVCTFAAGIAVGWTFSWLGLALFR